MWNLDDYLQRKINLRWYVGKEDFAQGKTCTEIEATNYGFRVISFFISILQDTDLIKVFQLFYQKNYLMQIRIKSTLINITQKAHSHKIPLISLCKLFSLISNPIK